MNIKKLINQITGKSKQSKHQKVKVDINYIQSHVEPSVYFGPADEPSETESESDKTHVNN